MVDKIELNDGKDVQRNLLKGKYYKNKKQIEQKYVKFCRETDDGRDSISIYS